MGPSRQCTQQMRYHRRTRLGMSYQTDINGTTSKLFHARQIDAQLAATAARDRQCRRLLLNQVGRKITHYKFKTSTKIRKQVQKATSRSAIIEKVRVTYRQALREIASFEHCNAVMSETVQNATKLDILY